MVFSYNLSVVFVLNILWNLLWGGRCLSNKDKKVFSNFFENFCTVWWIEASLYGWLNHIIFLFRFLVVVVLCLMFCWYCMSLLYPAFTSASLYGLIEFLNISLFADNCYNLNSIDFCSCLIMDGRMIGFCVDINYFIVVFLVRAVCELCKFKVIIMAAWNIK